MFCLKQMSQHYLCKPPNQNIPTSNHPHPSFFIIFFKMCNFFFVFFFPLLFYSSLSLLKFKTIQNVNHHYLEKSLFLQNTVLVLFMLSSFLYLRPLSLSMLQSWDFFFFFSLFRLSCDFGFTKLHILLLLICIFVLLVYPFLFDIRVVKDDKGKKKCFGAFSQN